MQAQRKELNFEGQNIFFGSVHFIQIQKLVLSQPLGNEEINYKR